MKRNLITVLIVLFVPLILFFLLSRTETVAKNDDIVANKPQVLKFTSNMCLDCQKMNKVFTDIFPAYADKIILTEIQVQDGKAFTDSLIKKYNVTLVPTIILIDKNGKQVKRIEGAIDKSEMNKYLKGLE